jgi:hypothetical protein
MAPPTKLNYQAPIWQAMLCLVKAGVQVPRVAVMNFPKLALLAWAAETGRRVSQRSRTSPDLSEVRAMKLKWGKLGKHRCRQCTGFPAEKTKKKSWHARKQSISRSRIWLVYATSANHNYTDLVLRLRFTKTHDPYQELPDYSFKECLMVALLIRFNQMPPASAESPSPKGRAQPPEEGEATTCMLNIEKQQEFSGKGNHSVSIDLAINFSPSLHFGLPTSMKAALP